MMDQMSAKERLKMEAAWQLIKQHREQIEGAALHYDGNLIIPLAIELEEILEATND
ncbi:hypothetical protein [Weissella koreensis]|uniref:hypothetical protein n=2 Tax=Weissella koreensis TaxID=165096 RepID=UPI0012B4C7F8|nr:hypothetical protein [Weissella koreensis]QGN19954.1 hypothetical protein GKC51_01255 [Weissella koreensis]